MKQGWGGDDRAWISALNPMHVSLRTPEAPFVPLLVHRVVWLTSRTLHPSDASPRASQPAGSWRELQPWAETAAQFSLKTFSAPALGQGRATSCLLAVLPRSSKPQHGMVQPSDPATSIQRHARALLFLSPDPSQMGRGRPAWRWWHGLVASPNLEQHIISSLLTSLDHKAVAFLLKWRTIPDGQDHRLSIISAGERAVHSTFSPLTWYK